MLAKFNPATNRDKQPLIDANGKPIFNISVTTDEGEPVLQEGEMVEVSTRAGTPAVRQLGRQIAQMPGRNGGFWTLYAIASDNAAPAATASPPPQQQTAAAPEKPKQIATEFAQETLRELIDTFANLSPPLQQTLQGGTVAPQTWKGDYKTAAAAIRDLIQGRGGLERLEQKLCWQLIGRLYTITQKGEQ